MTDYTVGDTIYHKFTTRAFATGIPTVLAGTPVVSIYEDDSVTQITAGITLSVDFDSVVGLNHLTIVATGGNGYEIDKFYQAVITTGTVGGVSVVGETVWTFSLGASASAQDLANGTDGLGAIKTDTAAILVDTSTTLDAAIAVIDTNVDQIETAVITNAAGTDIAADIIAVKAETALIVADTAEIGTAGAGLTDLGGMSTGMKAEINVEAKDVLFTDTVAELSGVPEANAALSDKINWNFLLARNKATQTASVKTIFADDTSTIVSTSALSSDGTTITRDEFS